jgi:hypothetical protein
MSVFHMQVLGLAEVVGRLRPCMLLYLHAAVGLFPYISGSDNAIMLLYDLIQ